MKVKDLIKQLEQFDQDWDVVARGNNAYIETVNAPQHCWIMDKEHTDGIYLATCACTECSELRRNAVIMSTF